MLPTIMMILPGTNIYIFLGSFKNQSNCKPIPIIEHFRGFLDDNECECLNVKFHMTINGLNNSSLKIGIYKKQGETNEEKGRDNSTEQRIVELPKVIDMQKRA